MRFNLLRKNLPNESQIKNSCQEDISKELSIQETERQRIADDLHDELGAPLMKINMNLELLQKKYPDLWDDHLFEELKYIQQNLFSTIRNTIFELKNTTVLRDGIKSTLQEIAKHYNSPYHSRINIGHFDPLVDELCPENQLHIFRLFQELMTNSFKHSSAWKIWLSVASVNDTLVLTYKDDGIGMKQDSQRGGFGIQNIIRRVEVLGGRIVFQPGPGCNVNVILPRHENNSSG